MNIDATAHLPSLNLSRVLVSVLSAVSQNHRLVRRIRLFEETAPWQVNSVAESLFNWLSFENQPKQDARATKHVVAMPTAVCIPVRL
jgi:hypothetical protein